MSNTAHSDGVVPQFEMRHRMRLALEHAGVSVGEMATLLDVDRNTVSRYLNGHTVPRKSVIFMWAMRTGLPVDWIIHGTTPPPDTTPRPNPTPPPVTGPVTAGQRPRDAICAREFHLVAA